MIQISLISVGDHVVFNEALEPSAFGNLAWEARDQDTKLGFGKSRAALASDRQITNKWATASNTAKGVASVAHTVIADPAPL